MKKQMVTKSLFLIIAGLLVLFFALVAFSSDQGVIREVKKATRKIDKFGQVDAAMTLPKNIVKANVQYQGGTFFTEARKSEIKRYRCSSCHNGKEVSIRNAAEISHADIRVSHGGKGAPLACDTCHNREDRDFLKTSKGVRIDMDHVYEMCGQCHFRQKKDWIGGAHGKRVTYWAGERVVKNCSSCHNPHSPRFEKRWPATYSVPLK